MPVLELELALALGTATTAVESELPSEISSVKPVVGWLLASRATTSTGTTVPASAIGGAKIARCVAGSEAIVLAEGWRSCR